MTSADDGRMPWECVHDLDYDRVAAKILPGTFDPDLVKYRPGFFSNAKLYAQIGFLGFATSYKREGDVRLSLIDGWNAALGAGLSIFYDSYALEYFCENSIRKA